MPKYMSVAYTTSVQLDQETDAIVRKKRRQGWKLSPWVRRKIMEEFGNDQSTTHD